MQHDWMIRRILCSKSKKIEVVLKLPAFFDILIHGYKTLKGHEKMTKTDLVNVVAAETDVSKKTVDTVINAVIEAVANALKEGDKVQLIGFGTFEAKNVAAREGHNPKTGEAIQIPESKKVAFSASKVLKDSLN